MMSLRCWTAAAVLGLASVPTHSAEAQQSVPAVSPLHLSDLQRQAVEADPRLRQVKLEESRTALRLANIAAERRPALSVEGQVQYQSDVPSVPFAPTQGGQPFGPPKDSYDTYFRVDQALLDATMAPRRALESAQLEENQARVRTTLFALRQDVNSAFFGALILQERAAALETGIADLEARLNEVNVRVKEGAAITAEAQAVEATLLQRRQELIELRGSRAAALSRLGELTARQIGEQDVLAIPELAAPVKMTRATLQELRARPEYEQFARTRDRLGRQQDVVLAQDRPRLSAFARAGYARPGLTVFGDEFDAYWLGGLRINWRFFNWGTTGREHEALRIQQDIVQAEEAAFTETLQRTIQDDLAALDRLQATLDMDARIIELRTAIEQSARTRLNEGVITAAEYVDRNTELLDARVTRARHEVEMAQAGARFLTTMGVEVR